MRINIYRSFFTDGERELLTIGSMKVTAFRYSTGTEALKVENNKGFFIILPFQGQQIWRANFLGKELGMITSIKEPIPNTDFLKTYGGFIYHCGICAFGSPQADDNHPQHGEIPNIAYNEAYIDCGEDEKGTYIAISGLLDYNISFVRHYHFMPSCRLYENESVLHFDVTLHNLRTEPMEYMYLAHINFRPINGAKLIYNAKRDAEHIKVFKKIGANLPKDQAEKLGAYMDRTEKDPSLADHVGNPDEIYDPEICFAIRYDSDQDNRGYTLQYEDGIGACYVNHPTDILPIGIRWISRTGTEDSMGMILPATAEHFGYSHAKRNGMIKTLAGGESLRFNIDAGFLDIKEADAVKEKIESILNKEC